MGWMEGRGEGVVRAEREQVSGAANQPTYSAVIWSLRIAPSAALMPANRLRRLTKE